MEYAGSTDPITMLHMAIQRMDEKAEKTNEALFAKLDKTNDKVDKLSEIVSQQAILFEKFATMEANHKTSIDRIHSRIDKHEQEQVEKFENRAVSIEKAVESIDKRVANMEKAPAVALGKVGNAILVVLGTGIGAWILFKFGIEVEK